MKKQIISDTKTYQPSTVDELLLDDAPKVNSFNGITSDAVARAVAGASGEVPQVTESDNGKVLSAVYDAGGPAVEWADAPSELPSVTGNAGKVLSVNSGATGVEWADAPSGVPEYSAADNGKVLGVVTTGVEETPELDWVEVQSGGSTVSTDGVISGDGSVADPVVLNIGSGLTTGTVTDWGHTTLSTFDTYGYPISKDQALAILTGDSAPVLKLLGNGEWSGTSDSNATRWIVVVGYYYTSEEWGNYFDFVGFNPYTEASHPSGDLSSNSYTLDKNNITYNRWSGLQGIIDAANANKQMYIGVAQYLPGPGEWYGCFNSGNNPGYTLDLSAPTSVIPAIVADVATSGALYGAGTSDSPLVLSVDDSLQVVQQGVTLSPYVNSSNRYGFALTKDQALAILQGTMSPSATINNGTTTWSSIYSGSPKWSWAIGYYDDDYYYARYRVFVTGTDGADPSVSAGPVVLNIADATLQLEPNKASIQTLVDAANNNQTIYLRAVSKDPSSSNWYFLTPSNPDCTLYLMTGAYENALAVTNPVPAFDTTTDLGKVLTVTANGLAWVTPA